MEYTLQDYCNRIREDVKDYLYIIACVVGAVVGIMIIKEHQKKITANAGTVQHVEKPNVWVKTALYTVGETFAIYVLFFLLSATF